MEEVEKRFTEDPEGREGVGIWHLVKERERETMPPWSDDELNFLGMSILNPAVVLLTASEGHTVSSNELVPIRTEF